MHDRISFQEYFSTFVQPVPRYAVLTRNGWKSRNKCVSDQVVKAHLDQKQSVATLGRWYPEYAIFDFDDVPLSKVDEIRSQLSLGDSHAMLFTSQSPDSYHLLFRPTYNGQPPTINTLQRIMGPLAKRAGIELYPQRNRCVRLPFGKFQECLDEQYCHLMHWSNFGYWFCKLDEFDIITTPHQMLLNLRTDTTPLEPGGVFSEGANLFVAGLQAPSTRHDSQFKVIYYLWRRGVPQDETIRQVNAWIARKHNGMSKDVLRNPKQVRLEIEAQTRHVYTKYDLAHVFPDDTHNHFNGYITKPDLEQIILAGRGSLPKIRFLFHLLKYAYPRRHRAFLNVHRDNLVSWSSSRTYTSYLNEFEVQGLLKRGSSYLAGQFSKAITLNWQFRQPEDAVLYEGRSVDTFEATAKLLLKPEGLRDILRKAGTEKSYRNKIVQRVFSPSEGGQMHTH